MRNPCAFGCCGRFQKNKFTTIVSGPVVHSAFVEHGRVGFLIPGTNIRVSDNGCRAFLRATVNPTQRPILNAIKPFE
jgi:hypothetical protein